MSEKETTKKNSTVTTEPMKHGEEPTGLLHQLVWSPVETLKERGLARVFVGKDTIAIVLYHATLDPELGIVPTESETVGNEKSENAVSLPDKVPTVL